MTKIYLKLLSFCLKFLPIKQWCVIRTDNYGRSGESPYFDEVYVQMDLTYVGATKLAKRLNSSGTVYSDHYYRVVTKDYKLARFEDNV